VRGVSMVSLQPVSAATLPALSGAEGSEAKGNLSPMLRRSQTFAFPSGIPDTDSPSLMSSAP
jgi:hypothetical protein